MFNVILDFILIWFIRISLGLIVIFDIYGLLYFFIIGTKRNSRKYWDECYASQFSSRRLEADIVIDFDEFLPIYEKHKDWFMVYKTRDWMYRYDYDRHEYKFDKGPEVPKYIVVFAFAPTKFIVGFTRKSLPKSVKYFDKSLGADYQVYNPYCVLGLSKYRWNDKYPSEEIFAKNREYFDTLINILENTNKEET